MAWLPVVPLRLYLRPQPTLVATTPGTRWNASSSPQKHPPAKVATASPSALRAGTAPSTANAPASRAHDAGRPGSAA